MLTKQASGENTRLAAYLFAGVVPGLFAYAGFAHFAARSGPVRASIAFYIGPVDGSNWPLADIE